MNDPTNPTEAAHTLLHRTADQLLAAASMGRATLTEAVICLEACIALEEERGPHQPTPSLATLTLLAATIDGLQACPHPAARHAADRLGSLLATGGA